MISVIVGCCQHTRSWIWYKLGCFLIVQGEKESYQGELFEHAALAVYVGWLSGGHLSDLWREQFDLGKTIFSHFQQCRASRQMWCSVTFCKGVRWTFFWGSVEISDYLDNLWHLLIHWERWWWGGGGDNKAGTGRKYFTKRRREMQQEQRIAVGFLFRLPPPCFQIRESSIQNLTWNFLTWVLGDCYSQYEVPRYWGRGGW